MLFIRQPADAELLGRSIAEEEHDRWARRRLLRESIVIRPGLNFKTSEGRHFTQSKFDGPDPQFSASLEQQTMATRQARNIVRNILGTAETPLSTKQIYDLAWKKFPKATIEPSQWTYGNPQMKLKTNYERKEPPLPPRPITHPIPSMK